MRRRGLDFQHSPSSRIVDVDHSKFFRQIFVVNSSKSFRENVSCLTVCWSEADFEKPFFNLFLDKVSIYLHVLSSIMMNRILAILMAAWLSQYNTMGCFNGTHSSSNSLFNQIPSQIPYAIARNSALALLRATTDCFLLRHVTKFPQTNEQ